MAITTAMCASYKRDLMNGSHHHQQSRTFTATGTTTQSWTGVSSFVGMYTGVYLSGTNVAAGTRVVDVDPVAATIFVSKASTGALGTVTLVGDIFNAVLFKSPTTGTYGSGTSVYADITGNSDEVVGTGYTAGGQAMTNVDPVTSGAGAFTSFSPNPTWTGASFSTTGLAIVSQAKNGPIVKPTTSVHDFGGVQTVTSGTFTAVMPAADISNAILRLT